MSGFCSVPRVPFGVRFAWRLAPIFALLALAVLVVSGVIDPLQSGTLTMLPVLALAVVMLTRPYLGERVIARLRRSGPERGRASSPVATESLGRTAYLARGGRLIAVALAGRAPPAPLAGCR